MFARFSDSQSVELAVPNQPVPLQHYLRQPQRLVRALVDPSRIQMLRQDCFRLKMRPLSFLMLTLQPTVDLQVWAEPDGSIRVQSIACEIRGIEYINQRFSLNLTGVLIPEQDGEVTYLRGRANLQVQVDVPPPLMLTPQPILEATGNGLLHSVLLTVKQRLMHQLLVDYREWAAQQDRETWHNSPNSLAPNGEPFPMAGSKPELG
ncbi:DUF1997 domain-containing protein [Leptolyngbya sp. FACHB-711]|uniref:DUF1997 domain-containing protein n=1 Tax=unclassified Leptolyngbya TaxID=2650499 RepID=UPI001683C596|nr:DUF1997 domain-containing protein [Leptolyngbya sp. FACHB-711]MBD1853530.1 DUF1997 domain-containing protein [Cyanobacteria bacterium FACHB-502]MBD2027186.1 DUF1997 domain-containing protein [Leptolyngbya sp. FACHB-711]